MELTADAGIEYHHAGMDERRRSMSDNRDHTVRWSIERHGGCRDNGRREGCEPVDMRKTIDGLSYLV